MEIIVALISGGSALLVSVVTNLMSASATRKLLEYRLTQLEEKVDKHNHVIERMTILEYEIQNLKEKTKGDDSK